jgi:DNA-binding transcriptional LysR family regulator
MWMRSGTVSVSVRYRPPFVSAVTSNHLVQWELCKEGAGICIMMEEIGDSEPGVRRVLPKMTPLPIPVWLVCHRELQTSRRIRLVFDRIAETLT